MPFCGAVSAAPCGHTMGTLSSPNKRRLAITLTHRRTLAAVSWACVTGGGWARCRDGSSLFPDKDQPYSAAGQSRQTGWQGACAVGRRGGR
jgi:hypothetical protein